MEKDFDKELEFHIVAYAMLMRASGVITEQQFAGIKASFDIVEAKDRLSLFNRIMAACNQAYEMKLRQMIDNKSLIIKP